MKPKTIILMVVAIVCGLGASYMTSRLLAERANQSAEDEKVAIVVAKKNLEIGVAIKEKNLIHLFELREVAKETKPKGAVQSLQDLKDKFLKRNLRKGDFVTTQDVVEDFSAITLPDGKRAMALRVNMETGVAGFATLPGSHVDLLWFRRTGGEEQTQCWTLLEDVLVLAADQSPTRNGDKTAMPASVVTVALTPEETREVTLARETGQLQLVLRRYDDKNKTEHRQTTVKDLLKKLKHEPVEEPPPVVQAPSKDNEKAAEPVYRPYLVHITVGERTRTKQFLQDKSGKIVQPGEIPPQPEQPPPPQQQPPPPQQQPPANPQLQPAPQSNPSPPASPNSRKDV